MWLLWLLALSPVDLVPGAPQLRAAEGRLAELIAVSQGAERATAQLQALWTTIPAPDLRPVGKQTGKQARKSAEPPVDRCAVDQRLEPGWRAERFGAAWREAAQAVQAAREPEGPMADAAIATAATAETAAAAASAAAALAAAAFFLFFALASLSFPMVDGDLFLWK